MSALNAAENAFRLLLAPTLAELHFEELKLEGCMHPEFLFRRDRICFSLSWDWRDRYLDVCLGRLFWFRDVMPRIVVIGDFSYWDSEVTWNAIGSKSDFDTVFARIRDSIPAAVDCVEVEYPNVLESFRKSRNIPTKIDEYLGKEVELADLEHYMA